MLVINVLDWTHYVPALADFLLTIAETMVEGQRPPPINRNDGRPGGRLIRFEEGILCQVSFINLSQTSPTLKTFYFLFLKCEIGARFF